MTRISTQNVTVFLTNIHLRLFHSCYVMLGVWASYCVFYFEGYYRKTINIVENLKQCKHGEPGRCRLETPGIQSPIKKIRSGFLLCMTSYTVTVPCLWCQRLCDCRFVKPPNKRVVCDFMCPFNVSTAVTVQAWKVRGVNVQHWRAILRASQQVSFRCYISSIVKLTSVILRARGSGLLMYWYLVRLYKFKGC